MKNKLDETIKTLLGTQHENNLENTITQVFKEYLNKQVNIEFLGNLSQGSKLAINRYNVKSVDKTIDMIVDTKKLDNENLEVIIDMFSLN